MSKLSYSEVQDLVHLNLPCVCNEEVSIQTNFEETGSLATPVVFSKENFMTPNDKTDDVTSQFTS